MKKKNTIWWKTPSKKKLILLKKSSWLYSDQKVNAQLFRKEECFLTNFNWINLLNYGLLLIQKSFKETFTTKNITTYKKEKKQNKNKESRKNQWKNTHEKKGSPTLHKYCRQKKEKRVKWNRFCATTKKVPRLFISTNLIRMLVIWQYRLCSFQGRDTKLERLLAKNQLYVVKWNLMEFWEIEKIKIMGAVLELPAKHYCWFVQFWGKWAGLAVLFSW